MTDPCSWQEIARDRHDRTSRMRIPGGWLYKMIYTAGTVAGQPTFGAALAYVPAMDTEDDRDFKPD